MVLLSISFIIGIIICHNEEYCPDFSDYLSSGMLGLLIGLIPTLFVVGIVGCFLPKKVIKEETKIIALNDSTSLEGKKYLFSGYVNEEYIYRYVIETKDGKQIKELQNSENVYIKYDNENPRIIEEATDFKYKWLWLFAIEITDTKYTIYVPEGTITERYDINLEN